MRMKCSYYVYTATLRTETGLYNVVAGHCICVGLEGIYRRHDDGQQRWC